MSFSARQHLASFKEVLSLALPMVLSTITVPLLGFVDIAVIGHLEDAVYLASVALGSTMITFILWLFGFLRMSTTGLAAQAWGARDKEKLLRVLLQGTLLATLFSLFILLFHSFIIDIVYYASEASSATKTYAREYFAVRVWSLPAALMNLVLMGWLLGAQNAKKPMLMILIINSLNILLDFVFVIGFDLKVQGVAAATVLAEYSGMFLGLYFVLQELNKEEISIYACVPKSLLVDLFKLIKLNRDIFVRSLCLQAAFSFMTFKGAALGENVLAANAVLMNFLLLVSFAMDGFAYAVEAMVGKAIGAKNKIALYRSLFSVTLCSIGISLCFCFAFSFFGKDLVNLITSIHSVRLQAYLYLPWLVALPLIAMWCFLLDGVFIGATLGREMRNCMFVSMSGFFAIWWLASELFSLGNHALWAAMLCFMLMRGLTQAVVFSRWWREESVTSQV